MKRCKEKSKLPLSLLVLIQNQLIKKDFVSKNLKPDNLPKLLHKQLLTLGQLQVIIKLNQTLNHQSIPNQLVGALMKKKKKKTKKSSTSRLSFAESLNKILFNLNYSRS